MVGKVWPLELIARESNPDDDALDFDHLLTAAPFARPALFEPATRSGTPTFGEFLVSWQTLTRMSSTNGLSH